MAIKLSNFQNSVLVFLLERSGLEPEVDLYQVRFDDALAHQVTIGVARTAAANNVYGVFTLPARDSQVFITATDGDPFEIGKILGFLEDYDASTKHLHLGEFCLIPSVYLKERGYVGAVLLRAETSNIFKDIPDITRIKDKDVCFSLVVFLSEDEFEYKSRFGYDALLDKFNSESKDIVTLNRKIS